MSRQLERAWDDLRSFITSFRFVGLVWEASDFVFLPPARVLKQFLIEHPKHQSCKAGLLQRLQEQPNYTGKVRVPMTSELGRALAR